MVHPPWYLKALTSSSPPSAQAPLESLLPKEPVIPAQPQETPHSQGTSRDVPTIHTAPAGEENVHPALSWVVCCTPTIPFLYCNGWVYHYD